MTEREKDIIEKSILLRPCVHRTVSIYLQEHPECIFVRNEDLSRNPLGQFRQLYEKLRLQFIDKGKKKIIAGSGAHYHAEQQAGNDFIRNSQKNSGRG